MYRTVFLIDGKSVMESTSAVSGLESELESATIMDMGNDLQAAIPSQIAGLTLQAASSSDLGGSQFVQGASKICELPADMNLRLKRTRKK
jgi:hypothetical protein